MRVYQKSEYEFPEPTIIETSTTISPGKRVPDLEVKFSFKAAVFSSTNEEDELNEVVLKLEESNQTPIRIFKDLCGPFIKDDEPMTVNNGITIR